MYLSNREYNKLQQITINLFRDITITEFVKCTFFVTDIGKVEELNKQTALFRKNEAGHSGIIVTYEGIKSKIYNPKPKAAVHQIINSCDICTGAKYDRNPVKKKLRLTKTRSTVNQIVHIDLYFIWKHTFINFIDRFSKHVITFYLEDRNSIIFLEKIK